MDTTTLLIADDHTVVRKGLRLLLEAEADLHVLAEAGDVPETLALTVSERPDVLLLDLNMPGGSGLEAIPRILTDSPGIAIVVLTMQADPAFVRKALQLGASGFVLKEAADDELLQAIRLAAGGEAYVNPRLAARLAIEPVPESPRDHLTDRELDVLRLIALGHTNTEIGAQLAVSTRTVETHRAHIQQKIGRSSRAQLVRYALNHGLVEV